MTVLKLSPLQLSVEQFLRTAAAGTHSVCRSLRCFMESCSWVYRFDSDEAWWNSECSREQLHSCVEELEGYTAHAAKEIEELQSLISGADALQSHVRAMIAAFDALQVCSAVKIQAATRGVLARKVAMQQRHLAEVAAKREFGAIRVQAAVRMRLAMRLRDALRCERETLVSTAAIRIQRQWRLYRKKSIKRARRRLQRQRRREKAAATDVRANPCLSDGEAQADEHSLYEAVSHSTLQPSAASSSSSHQPARSRRVSMTECHFKAVMLYYSHLAARAKYTLGLFLGHVGLKA